MLIEQGQKVGKFALHQFQVVLNMFFVLENIGHSRLQVKGKIAGLNQDQVVRSLHDQNYYFWALKKQLTYVCLGACMAFVACNEG